MGLKCTNSGLKRRANGKLIYSLISTLDTRQIELLEKAAMLGARPKQ